MNSVKRMSACFDVQYSLLQGIRSCAAAEFMITIFPFVFCNSGTAKLRSRNVSALVHNSASGQFRSLSIIVRPADVHIDHLPPFGRVFACES